MAYRNKEDQAAAAKRHYEANKQAIKARAVRNKKKAKARNCKFILEYLLEHPCVDCKEPDPIVLEFDHLRDKDYTISYIAQSGLSLTRLENEIAKCEVRCANCHRRITHQRRAEANAV